MADWDQVYHSKTVADGEPSRVLLDNQHLLPASGRALDYASGLAGNAVFLANKGFQVSAWDLSNVAVEKVNQYAATNKLALNAEVKDLESDTEKLCGKFDVIVVSYFLHRESFRKIYELLNLDGLLFYQTFCGEQINGTGPSRSEFRLKRGELLKVFSDMQLLSYREDIDTGRENSKPDQVYFVAQKK